MKSLKSKEVLIEKKIRAHNVTCVIVLKTEADKPLSDFRTTHGDIIKEEKDDTCNFSLCRS